MYDRASLIGEFSNCLKNLDEDRAYYYYTGYYPNVDNSYFIKSPFKPSEKTPSFKFYQSNSNKFKYYYYCFSTSNKGNIITLVMELFNLNYLEAVRKIISDELAEGDYISFSEYKTSNKNNNTTTANKEKIKIIVENRDFSDNDLSYWYRFYELPFNYLKNRNVNPCKKIWIKQENDWIIMYNSDFYKDKLLPIYSYRFDNSYKIYNPLEIGNLPKWLSNTNSKIIQGLEFLNRSKSTLIITKSYKDVLCIDYHLGINSIAFQSEVIIPNEQTINYFKVNYKNIYILYDNDLTGINSVKKIITLYPFITPLTFLEETGEKDISDFVASYSAEELKKYFKNYGKFKKSND